MTRVHVCTPLQRYTGGRSPVDAAGRTVGEILADLDRRYPGIRFRMVNEQGAIREHIRLHVGSDTPAALETPVAKGGEVHILAALSGG